MRVAYGAAKRWLPERFGEAAARLAAEMHGSVAVFGSVVEKPLCDAVARAAGGRGFAGEIDLLHVHRYDRRVPRLPAPMIQEPCKHVHPRWALPL